MENIDDFWRGLNWQEVIDVAVYLASGSIYEPRPLGNELYSAPFELPRSRLGFAGRLAVPNAYCLIVRGYGGFRRIFEPGIYSLSQCPPGPLSGQLVDMSRRSLSIHLNSLYTADLAQISLQVDVEFRVDDPLIVTRKKLPLQVLIGAIESKVRQTIENLPHSSLVGGGNLSQLANKGALERQIRRALLEELTPSGLRILGARIVRVEGDPTYLAFAAQVALAQQQLLAEEAVLQTRRLLASSQRELTLYQAETERLAVSAKEEAALDEARRQAQMFELETSRREFQRMMEETRLAHERAIARIEALGQAATVLADPRHLAITSAAYASSGHADGREQVLDKVISNLVQLDPTAVPPRSNGHSSR
ncbi:MAG: hypothetical protein Kow0063_18580 [Anaerolineae bacterium]